MQGLEIRRSNSMLVYGGYLRMRLLILTSLSLFLLPNLGQAEDLAEQGRASYNFNMDSQELSAAEIRLKALEEQAEQKIKASIAEQKDSSIVEIAVDEPVAKAQVQIAVAPTEDLQAQEEALLQKLSLGSFDFVKKSPAEVQIAEKTTEPQKVETASKVTSNSALDQLSLAEENALLRQQLLEQEEIINNLQRKLNQSSNTSRQSLQLRAEMNKLQKKLVMSETEIERLSSILDDYNNRVLGIKPKVVKSKYDPKHHFTKKASTIKTAQPKLVNDPEVPILTVQASKANLRTGPGFNHSPLMTVAKGTRLVVEKRQGEWLRVIAPNGVRSWISSTVVSYGPSAAQSPTRTVNIQGYNPNVEAHAMQLLSRRS